MLRAFFLAIGQFGDPAIRRVFAKTVAITLALFAALGVGVFAGLRAWFGGGTTDPGGFASAAGAVAAAILAGVLLWRVVAMFVLNLFSDAVVEAVERRHYPRAHAEARAPGRRASATMAARSAGRAIGYNLVALPLYILLLPTGIGAPALFFGVNALLLGHDLETMVRSRFADAAELGRVRRIALGLLIALMLAVPFVNFLAPVLGAAMAVHLVHRHEPRHEEGRGA